MATVMTSHRSGAPPPLPSRNANKTVHRSQSTTNTSPNVGHPQGRSRSIDVPPQVPPPDYNRRPSDPPGGGNDGRGGAYRGGGGAGDRALPPLPSRGNPVDNSAQPPPIVRKSFETKSFVNRHTARAYSGPSNGSDADDPHGQKQNSRLPPPPSRQNRGPDLPPGRPPKSNVTSSSTRDFERRFAFHDVKDFPDPEPIEHYKKTNPSLISSVRIKDPPVPRGKNQLGYL